MRAQLVKDLKEQINNLKSKIEQRVDEDLKIKKVQPGEIDLSDPESDEVNKLQQMSPDQQEDVMDKIEQDINENDELEEKRGYSAKAAHAGHDIGKKGKNFDKIAKSAGKKYGSKAAGERVAGAVLAKLRNEGLNESLISKNADLKEGIEMFLSGQVNEKLKPSMGIGAYIDDFVHSKNNRFAGKSKEQRMKMAKGAYYGAMKNESSTEITKTAKKADPQADYDAGFRYYVIDGQTKKIIGKYKSGSKASSVVDRKDNEYGAYRYRRQPIELILQGISKNPAINEDASDSEQLSMSPELLLRTMEWAKECGGEDIQLHKYVEAMSELMASKGSLTSDDYEQILSKITPNDPAINDEGSGQPEDKMD